MVCIVKSFPVRKSADVSRHDFGRCCTDSTGDGETNLNSTQLFSCKVNQSSLYTGYVEPHFQYCCSAWGCCNSTDILQLQRLQNRAARIVTNSQFDAPSKPLIQSLGWKTIQELINRQVNLTVFKCLNSIAPKYLCDIFTKNTVNATRSLRNTNTDLELPLRRSANGQKCFSLRGAKCRNGLSTEAKQTTSIKAFMKLDFLNIVSRFHICNYFSFASYESIV